MHHSMDRIEVFVIPATASDRIFFPISSKGSFICTIPGTGYWSLLYLLLPVTGYSFQLAAQDLLYAPSHGQDIGLCYTRCSTLVESKQLFSGSTRRDQSDDPPHHEQTLSGPIPC